MTVHTFKRFLSRVDPQVSVVVPVCSEGLAALVTLVRFFPGVNPLVLLQTASMEKPLPTHLADAGLLPCVAPLVISERVFVVERLRANGAVELLVLTVAFFMKLERTCGAETFQADFAAERFHQRLGSPSSL